MAISIYRFNPYDQHGFSSYAGNFLALVGLPIFGSGINKAEFHKLCLYDDIRTHKWELVSAVVFSLCVMQCHHFDFFFLGEHRWHTACCKLTLHKSIKGVFEVEQLCTLADEQLQCAFQNTFCTL